MPQRIKLQVNSLLVNDEETNGSGGEMEEAVEEEIEVFEQDVFCRWASLLSW